MMKINIFKEDLLPNNNIGKYTFVKDYLFLKKHGENL